MTERALDTLVIGGGLHGLSAALHLARAGRRVVADGTHVRRAAVAARYHAALARLVG